MAHTFTGIVIALGMLTLAPGRVHSRPPLPRGWVDYGHHQTPLNSMVEAKPSQLEIVIVFRDSAAVIQQLKQHAIAASDPISPRYGQHLTTSQINALTAAPPEAVRAVLDWLASMLDSSVIHHQDNRIVLSCTVDDAERSFSTRFTRSATRHCTRVHAISV